MNSISKFTFLLLLGTQSMIAFSEVIKSDDGSETLISGEASMHKLADGSVAMYDATGTAFLKKNSNSVQIRETDQFFHKDPQKVEIGNQDTLIAKYSDGSMTAQDGSSILIRNTRKMLTLNDGRFCQMKKNYDGTVSIQDGSLNLEKELNGIMYISDGYSAFLTKSPKRNMIKAGDAKVENISDGSVKVYDGLATYLEKDNGCTGLADENMYIAKNAKGLINLGDGNAVLKTNADGSVEMKIDGCHVSKESDDAVMLIDDDSFTSIAKDSTSGTHTENGYRTIIKDQTGVQMTLRLTQQEMKNLKVKITGHILRAETSSKGKISARLPNRIKEEDVKMCFLSGGTVTMLVHRKKQTIQCPKGTTRSESLKQFQERKA